MSIFVLVSLAFGIGVIAGLRSLTAPAAAAWAARLGWIHLQGTSLAFMASTVALWLFSLGALGELINDKLPRTPRRTLPPSVIVRALLGALAAATLAAGVGQSTAVAAVAALAGAAGSLLGTYGGYHARLGLRTALGGGDLPVALLEDVVAVGGGFLHFYLASRA